MSIIQLSIWKFVHTPHSRRHSSWRGAASPEIFLSSVLCNVHAVLCVSVDMSCHVAVSVPPPLSHPGLGPAMVELLFIIIISHYLLFSQLHVILLFF